MRFCTILSYVKTPVISVQVKGYEVLRFNVPRALLIVTVLVVIRLENPMFLLEIKVSNEN